MRHSPQLPLLLALMIALPIPAAAQPLSNAPRQGIGVRVVVTHLLQPDAFTVDPAGRLFIAEHTTGTIDLFDPSTGDLTVFATVPNVFVEGDSGLMGIALHPQYPEKPFIYVYATRTVVSTPRVQILRFRDTGGVGSQPRVIFTGNTVVNGFHQGGRILFGPDGMLYAVDGDRDDPATSQDLSVDAGKMLRMTPAGRAAPGLPSPNTAVWAYGLRNSFGFSFDPMTGLLWETEDGPECNDEINIVRASRNYGWGPSETCSTPPPPPINTNQDGPNPTLPVWYSATPITPVGNVFCNGCGLPASEGTMFFGNFATGDVMRATLTANRRGIASIDVAYSTGVTAGVLSMEAGPDHALYFSDNHSIYQLIAT
jgi:glucose/arabinose dehydrogenase